jgi:GTP-binding protein
VADRALRLGLDPDDASRLGEVARGIRFDLSEGSEEPGGDLPELLVDGRAPGPELRSPDVEAVVSQVARHPQVRVALRERQRELAAGGAVMEGRDIGTVVLPDADLKVFLTASLDTRTDRRSVDGPDADAEDRAQQLVSHRDRLDARTNPLEPAPEAVEIDSTDLSADEVVELVLELVRNRGTRTPREHVPRVAVVGRQNVGKSTLLNRLVGRKIAISHESPGVTRDRLEVEARWDGRTFSVVDTGGFAHDAEGIERSVARQAQRAAESADLILLVVDATAGIQEDDAILADRLRRSARSVLVVANKIDGESQEPLAAEFHGLGLGEPMAVSAVHGRGSGDLLDRMMALLPPGGDPRPEDEARFALVGRPNVGKSSLFNRLVDEERAVVHEEAGTTRDAIDSVVEVEGRTVRFVDTAGFRRRTKAKAVEFYGLVRSLRAIGECHVALLVVDASLGLTGEDKRVAARVAEAGRGLVVALNKWDLVDPEERDALFKQLQAELALFPGTPVLRTSAVRGTGARRIVPAMFGVQANWVRRVPTAEVNRVLERLLAAHPLPRGMGRIRYGTQVSAGPPTFVLFGARDPGPSYRRYLENALRREFGFDGVPVRLSLRPKPPRGAGRSGR